jgi:hypothetical protein
LVIPAIVADVAEVEVVVAQHERATLRVGDVFLKIDADRTRTDIEAEAMAMAPIPTPQVLWRKPPGSRSPPSPARHSAAGRVRPIAAGQQVLLRPVAARFQARYLTDVLRQFSGGPVRLDIPLGMRATILNAAEPADVELC